jgi:site-specific DNA-methyltransferase (cytosine-N4-specific)
MVTVCRELKRVLKRTGSMYIVLGDTYFGGGHGGNTLYKTPSGQLVKSVKQGESSNYVPIMNWKDEIYKPKCLLGIPWRVAFALIDDSWILRNDIIWRKPNAMPSSVKDRLTQTYEHIFHFVKNRKYYYDLDAIREPHTSVKDLGRKRLDTKTPKYDLAVKLGAGKICPSGYLAQHPKGKNPGDVLTKHDVAVRRFPTGDLGYTDPLHVKAYHEKGKNLGDFWNVCTKPFKGAHFAVYPEAICVNPILSSSPPNGTVLDPMAGSGTTCVVAKKLGRNFIGIELNPKYVELARKRLEAVPPRLDTFMEEG